LAPEELARRASQLASLCPAAVRALTLPGESAVGCVSFAVSSLPATVVAIDPGPLGADGLALRLRLGTPAVVARVSADRVLFDPRTLPQSRFPALARASQ